MKAKFKIGDTIKHISSSEIYTVTEVVQEKHSFFYKLKTDEKIIIEILIPEIELEFVTKQ